LESILVGFATLSQEWKKSKNCNKPQVLILVPNNLIHVFQTCSVRETLDTHSPGFSEVEFASIDLSSLLVVGGDIYVVTLVLDDSGVVGSWCAEGTFADFGQHLILLT
jgi:hypothetical protein